VALADSELLAAGCQGLLGFDLGGHVTRDPPAADDLSGRVAQRESCRRHPCVRTIAERLTFDLRDDLPPGRDHDLVVVERGRGVRPGEEVEIGPAQDLV
jgi:hypothetical protein